MNSRQEKCRDGLSICRRAANGIVAGIALPALYAQMVGLARRFVRIGIDLP